MVLSKLKKESEGTGIQITRPLFYAKLMQRLWIKGCRGIGIYNTLQPLVSLSCRRGGTRGGLVSCKRTDNKKS